jgi:predicted nucleic acid-binding protein
VPAVLVDAGALIALLDRGDRWHSACVEALGEIRNPLVTVWPVITEAMHLLADVPRAQEALFEMIEDDALGLVPLDDGDLARMKVLMRKYRDLPMDFADAALVRVAERDRLAHIISFDRHFRVYALRGGGGLVVLPLDVCWGWL